MHYCFDEFISRIFSLANCARDSQLSPKLTFLLEDHFPQQRLKIPKFCFPRLLCRKGMWPSPGEWGLRGSLIKEMHLCLLGSILFPVKIEMCKDLRWEISSHLTITRWWPRETDTALTLLSQHWNSAPLMKYILNELRKKKHLVYTTFIQVFCYLKPKYIVYNIYVYIYNYDHSMYKILYLLFVT